MSRVLPWADQAAQRDAMILAALADGLCAQCRPDRDQRGAGGVVRLYLSGAITGVVTYRDHFNRARAQLEASGYAVINPADIGERDGWDWTDFMRGALQLMLAAQGVALLPGWEASRGARLERTVALELGMDVRPLSEWLACEVVA